MKLERGCPQWDSAAMSQPNIQQPFHQPRRNGYMVLIAVMLALFAAVLFVMANRSFKAKQQQDYEKESAELDALEEQIRLERSQDGNR